MNAAARPVLRHAGVGLRHAHHGQALQPPGDLPAPYRKWFEARTALTYGEENPYPWTRLGYTYDWHRDAAQRRGLGEFIVPGGTEVIAVEQVTVWRWYRGLARIVRTDDTDGAGVRSGS